jgi:phage terminase large subunit
MTEQLIRIPYSPRPQFKPFHKRDKRFAAIVAHRRAGKTVSCLNDLQKAALLCEKPRPRFGYVAPYLKQAKSVAWDYMLHYSSPIPGIEVNHSELKVTYPNEGQVRLWGADNAEAMRGVYFDGVVLDEPADFNPSVWPEVIRPALADRLGWAVFIGTPKGHNGFYDICQLAKNDPDWFYLELKASETKLLDAAELVAARKLMTEDQYNQEFECSFDAAIQGAYYGVLMREAEEDGRICRVPHDPALPVHTAWDLGIGDSTVIWFAQQHATEVRIIDCYAASGVGLDHYAKILKDGHRAKYLYGEHIFPHDASVADLSTGRTRVQTLAGLGIRGRVLQREARVDDGIAAVRSMLPRCWFDSEKCRVPIPGQPSRNAIEALKQYRAEKDEERGIFSEKPLHDWCSDYADAMRYLARGLPNQSFAAAKHDRYSRSSGGESSWMSV